MIKKRNRTGNSVEAYACACMYAVQGSCGCRCQVVCQGGYATEKVGQNAYAINHDTVNDMQRYDSETVNG